MNNQHSKKEKELVRKLNIQIITIIIITIIYLFIERRKYIIKDTFTNSSTIIIKSN